MTVNELRKDFEKQFAALVLKGLMLDCAFPKKIGEHGMTKGVSDDVEIEPSMHYLFVVHPLIFDSRKLPETFLGFEIQSGYSESSVPEEFRAYEEGLAPYDICWSEEKIIAYAEEHALEICEQLGDYSLTHNDICDMLAGGDFENHKKSVAEERALRLSGYYDDMDDEFDFGDEDKE